MNYEPLYTFAEKHRVPYNELCTALRAALAAPQPEPLGYVSITGHGTYFRITITPELAALEQGGRKMWTPVVAAPPAAPAPAVPLTDEQFADIVAEASLEVDLAANPLKLLAFARAVLSAAPVVREPLIDEMDAVASKYAHKLALDLECVLSDYNGKWWDTAMQTIGEYRMAMNRIHEQESPTHMGEPVLPKHGIGGGAQPAVLPPMEDPNCPYIAPKGNVCNKCGHIHRGIGGGNG